jgi:hypothetical protein
MQFVRALEPFQNVVATGRAVLNSKLVLGNVVQGIVLVLGGGAFTKAMITALRVKLNGKVIFGDVSGTMLDLIQRYLVLQNDATHLLIDFSEPIARSIQGELTGCINTAAAGVSDFTVEVDIAGATTPTLKGLVIMRSPFSMTPDKGFDVNSLLLIRALIPTTVTETAAGEFQHDLNYGSQGSSLIKRVFISSTILTAFRVKRDSLDIFEGGNPGVLSADNTFIEQNYGRQAQANFYVYDPLMDGNQSDAVPTRRAAQDGGTESNFQWLFTASGAGVHTVQTDVYTSLALL